MSEHLLVLLSNQPASGLVKRALEAVIADQIGLIAAHSFVMSPHQRACAPYPFERAVVLECDAPFLGEGSPGPAEKLFDDVLGSDGLIGAFDAIGQHYGPGGLSTCERINLALTRPLSGQDAAFNHWYDTRHLPDGLRLPGYVGGQRFAQRKASSARAIPLPYLGLYELAGVPLVETIAALAERSGTPEMPRSAAFDASFYWAWYLERETSERG